MYNLGNAESGRILCALKASDEIVLTNYFENGSFEDIYNNGFSVTHVPTDVGENLEKKFLNESEFLRISEEIKEEITKMQHLQLLK